MYRLEMVCCAFLRRSYVGSRPIHLQILHHDQLAPYSVIVKQYYAINEQKLCPFLYLSKIFICGHSTVIIEFITPEELTRM